MSLKTTPILTSSFQNDSVFEKELKDAVSGICAEMKPSRNALNSIMQFAATYECVNTRIGRIDMILN